MKNKTEKVLTKITYWKSDKAYYFFVQFEYNDGKYGEITIMPQKELDELKKKYANVEYVEN
jgi:transposase